MARKVGDTFIEGEKLLYEVTKVNEDGSCEAKLIRVIKSNTLDDMLETVKEMQEEKEPVKEPEKKPVPKKAPAKKPVKKTTKK